MQNPDFGGSIGIRNCYFQNWDYYEAEILQTDNNPTGYDQKAIVFNNQNASVTTNYKASLLSNSTSAFSNTSQRKFIRTPDGSLHVVYESMGYVWYERSSNDGTSGRIIGAHMTDKRTAFMVHTAAVTEILFTTGTI